MDVDALLAHQHGLVTRHQLYARGLSPSAVAWRLHRGWTWVLPGVIACSTTPLTGRQRMIAAVLYGGPEAAIGSLTAAAWHGVLAAAVDPRVHLTVPAGRNLAGSAQLVITRTTRPDPAGRDRGPIRLTSPARSVADAARAVPGIDGARALVIEAVQRRLGRTGDLWHELEAGPRVGSRRLRSALREAESAAWSVPESDLLRVLSTSTVLPEVWANPHLAAQDGTRLPTPDCWVDAVALAIQVHSRRHHAAPDDWDATVMTDGVYAEHGIPVVGVTPNRIARDPDAVLRRIERAYLSALRRPRPDVVARRRWPP